MKVLHVLEGMYYGGSEFHVLTNCLAAQFATHGIYSLVPAPGDNNDFSHFFHEAGIPIYYDDFEDVRKEYDLVHFYSCFENAITHDIDRHRPALWTMTFNTRAYRTQIPILCTSFQTLLNQIPENESYLYRCAVDLNKFNPSKLIEHKVPNMIRICSAGKSELILDEVIGELLDNYKDWQYNVIQDMGGVEHSNIHYLGRVPDITPYLFNADFYVYAPKIPSACTCDISVIEPMACGLPVVVTDAWSVTEQVSHGDTGIFVEYNKDSIRQGVEWMIRNPEQRKIMGQSARKRAEELFDIEQRMPLLKYLYEREINKFA